MFVQPFYFVSYYVYWIEYDDCFFIIIFRRPIIIGWGRDTRMIFWPIQNSIRICGRRLDRQVDPIKIRFTGSPTLRPTTCGRPIVFQFQPLGAPNLSSWPCSNARLSSPKDTTTYQRSTHNSKHLMHNKEPSLQNKRASYEQLREVVMNMATQSGTCAPNPFWPYNHQPPPPASPPSPPAPPLY
jgi:hypothetical protein